MARKERAVETSGSPVSDGLTKRKKTTTVANNDEVSGGQRKRKDRPDRQEVVEGDGEFKEEGPKKARTERKFSERKGGSMSRKRRLSRGYDDDDDRVPGEEVMPPPLDRSKCKLSRPDMELIVDGTGNKSWKCDGCGNTMSTYFHFRSHKWKINNWKRKTGLLPPLEVKEGTAGAEGADGEVVMKKKKLPKRFKRDGRAQIQRSGVCRDWEKGECKYGVDRCRFRHEHDAGGADGNGNGIGKGDHTATTEFRLQKEEPLPGQEKAEQVVGKRGRKGKAAPSSVDGESPQKKAKTTPSKKEKAKEGDGKRGSKGKATPSSVDGESPQKKAAKTTPNKKEKAKDGDGKRGSKGKAIPFSADGESPQKKGKTTPSKKISSEPEKKSKDRSQVKKEGKRKKTPKGEES